MNRINLFRNIPARSYAFRPTASRATTFSRNPAILDSIAWGRINVGTTASPLLFGAILLVCSFAVGCSSEKPKTESSNTQPPATTAQPVTVPVTPSTLPVQTAAAPVHKKVVRRAPTLATYVDKGSGVSFKYPRKYSLKTGDAADELVSSDAVPMNFVQPGGVALAAVSVPEGAYPKSDLTSAFLDVSMNKSLTAEQCAGFSTPPQPTTGSSAVSEPDSKPVSQPDSKLMIGDLELQSTETVSTLETRQEAAKYYHVFENGACYEFALQIVTNKGESDEGGKPVDRDEVFQKLEKILATVKINPVKTTPVATPEVTAKDASTPAVSPAQ